MCYLRSTELCDLGLLVDGGAVRGRVELEPNTALSASLAPVKDYAMLLVIQSATLLNLQRLERGSPWVS